MARIFEDLNGDRDAERDYRRRPHTTDLDAANSARDPNRQHHRDGGRVSAVNRVRSGLLRPSLSGDSARPVVWSLRLRAISERNAWRPAPLGVDYRSLRADFGAARAGSLHPGAVY